MLKDLTFKQKLISVIGSLAIATLSFFFKGPLIKFLLMKVTVPLWVFPLTILLSIGSVFLFRRLLLFRNYMLQDMHAILQQGRVIGIFNGPSNVTVLEWSWIDPRILLVQTQDGKIIRTHYSLIILYH